MKLLFVICHIIKCAFCATTSDAASGAECGQDGPRGRCNRGALQDSGSGDISTVVWGNV